VEVQGDRLKQLRKEAKKLEKEIRALQGEGSDDEDSGGYGGKGKGKSKGYGKGKGKRSRYEEAEEDDGWPEDDQESRQPRQPSVLGKGRPTLAGKGRPSLAAKGRPSQAFNQPGSQMPKGVFRSESESYARLGGNAVQELAKNGGQAPRRSVHQHAALKMADADSAEDEQKPSKAESWAAATSAEAAELGVRRSQKNPKSAKELAEEALQSPVAGPKRLGAAMSEFGKLKRVWSRSTLAKCLRNIFRIPHSWISRITNHTVLEIASCDKLSATLLKRQLLFLAHVVRKPGDDPVRASILKPFSSELQNLGFNRKRSRPRLTWAREVYKHVLFIAGAQSSGLVGSVDDGGHMPAFGPSLTSRESVASQSLVDNCGFMGALDCMSGLKEVHISHVHARFDGSSASSGIGGGASAQPTFQLSSDAQPSAKTQEPAEHDETQDEVLDDKKPEAVQWAEVARPRTWEGSKLRLQTRAKEPAVTEAKEIDIPPEEPAVPEVKAKEPAVPEEWEKEWACSLGLPKVARKLAFWAGLDPKVCQRPKAGHGGITRSIFVNLSELMRHAVLMEQYAQWLSEMKLQATSARYHQQAELDVTREAIVAHSGELTEFKRHSTTVVQQLQAQVSELKRMMSEMVAEMRVLGRQHAEIHASYLREDSERGPSKSLGASGAPEVADLHGAIQASQEHTLSKFGEVDHAMSILHANHSVVHKELLDTKKDWTRGQDLLGQAIQTLSQDFADFQKHSTNVTNKVQSDMYHVEERSRDERDRLNKAEVQIAAIHQTVQASANELVLLRSEQVEGMPATSLVSRHPSPCNARHDATLVASGSGAFLSPLLQQASQNSQQQQSAQLQQQKLQYEQQLQQKLINQQLIRPVRSPAPAGSRGW
ncbi:unnamed protein product, partial [Polarella glacialis]